MLVPKREDPPSSTGLRRSDRRERAADPRKGAAASVPVWSHSVPAMTFSNFSQKASPGSGAPARTVTIFIVRVSTIMLVG